MNKKLTEVIKNEKQALEKLLELLDKQYQHVMDKEVLELDAIVDKMKEASKDIAKIEVERRKLVSNNSMQELVNSYGDEELDTEYRKIKILLESIKLQKDTNDLLIRQQMSYNNQILNIINPSREIKTYNSYGNLKR